ncbi:MAG TPA: ADP-ribosylation factor-like protein [Candidatus Lokiarchaeia archaeon]|nr:ADP-ribosylation factor-like protein [Candidatus Lokiarchaeia archaeon]
MPKELKFLFCGLANAGKTSILRTLDNDFEKIPLLTPTVGVNYNTFKVMGFTIAVWDLGGQLKYRKKYLLENDRYFQETSALFYVIDVQDVEQQKESLSYLESIRDALASLQQEDVSFTIMLHKFDPHVRGKENNIEKEVAKIKERVDKILASYTHMFFETTIYEPPSIFRAFSQTLLNYVPQAEIIWGKIEEIARDFSSPMAILLDSGGYIYGQWHSSEAQLMDLAKFTRIAQEFARLAAQQTSSEFTLLSMNDAANIAVITFPVGVEIFMFCLLVPRTWLEQDAAMQDQLISRHKELAKVLQVFE